MSVPPAQVVGDRVLTVPNLLSFAAAARRPGLPVAVLGPEADGAAVLLADGQRASPTTSTAGSPAAGTRSSRLGQLLDPLADRLYILATLIGLGIRDIVPLVAASAPDRGPRRGARLCAAGAAQARARARSTVHYLGKAATLNLLYAFPLLLLGDGTGTAGATVARVLGWAFAIWGTGLYWWAGAALPAAGRGRS